MSEPGSIDQKDVLNNTLQVGTDSERWHYASKSKLTGHCLLSIGNRMYTTYKNIEPYQNINFYHLSDIFYKQLAISTRNISPST